MPLAATDWSPLWISLETSLTATTITLFLGLAAASWRERHRGPAMAFVDGACLLPLVLPPTVVGFFLLLLFGRRGPLGKLLLRLGTTVVFSWTATVIAAAVVAFPLMYLTARAARYIRGKATTAAAITVAGQENTTVVPSRSKSFPRGPRRPKSSSKKKPTTVGGSTSGRRQAPSTKAIAGPRCRSRHEAAARPRNKVIVVAVRLVSSDIQSGDQSVAASGMGT